MSAKIAASRLLRATVFAEPFVSVIDRTPLLICVAPRKTFPSKVLIVSARARSSPPARAKQPANATAVLRQRSDLGVAVKRIPIQCQNTPLVLQNSAINQQDTNSTPQFSD